MPLAFQCRTSVSQDRVDQLAVEQRLVMPGAERACRLRY